MDAFVEKYLLHVASHAENTLSGNYRKGNTAATELERMNQYLLKLEDTTAARSHIDEIICSDLPNAVMWIAPVCKEEQYKTDLVRNKLLRYSKDKTLGILSLNAAMFLKML